MSKKLFFDFYGVAVTIASDWEQVLNRLSKDFSYFRRKEIQKPHLSINIRRDRPGERDERSFSYKSEKVAFFDEADQRICSYFGKVETRISFQKEEALIIGEELYPVHEVAYLLILSRVGKKLDLNGLHRLHSGAFVKDGILFLALFPSGVGKSTLIATLLEDEVYELFSDDSPLINGKGKVLPFPIRLGIEEGAIPTSLLDKESYPLERFRFGKKELFSLEDLNWKVGDSYKKVVLLTGKRGESASYHKSLGIKHFLHMFREGVIGFGLPILFEYFWENGLGDFFKKVKIVVGRTIALGMLFLKAKKYQVTLSSDLKQNKTLIEDLIKSV